MGTHVDGDPEEGPSRAGAQGVIEDGSLEDFYRTGEKMLLRFLLRRGVPLADAEDLMVEAMIAVGQRWSTLHTKFAYACRVALNRWRKMAVEHARLRAAYPQLVGPQTVEEDPLRRWEQDEHVEELLGRLSPVQREVVWGRQEGYSTGELAARLGIPVAAVRRHLSEGHARLRGQLSDPAAAGSSRWRGAAAGDGRVARPDQGPVRDWTRDGGNTDE